MLIVDFVCLFVCTNTPTSDTAEEATPPPPRSTTTTTKEQHQNALFSVEHPNKMAHSVNTSSLGPTYPRGGEPTNRSKDSVVVASSRLLLTEMCVLELPPLRKKCTDTGSLD